MDSGVPPTSTKLVETKPEPETVSVNAAEPAFTLVGLMELTAGVVVVVVVPPPPPELPPPHPITDATILSVKVREKRRDNTAVDRRDVIRSITNQPSKQQCVDAYLRYTKTAGILIQNTCAPLLVRFHSPRPEARPIGAGKLASMDSLNRFGFVLKCEIRRT